MKIHIKCSEFGWVKNVTDGGIPFYRVGMESTLEAKPKMYYAGMMP